jgi:hypothetical protein
MAIFINEFLQSWLAVTDGYRMDDSAPENIALPNRRNAALQQNGFKKCEAKQAFSV